MSFESKSKPEATLYDELMAIPYHDLKKDFEKRGIGEIWGPGQKRADLVDKALEKLGWIKEASIELSGNDPEAEVDEKELKKLVDKKQEEKQLALERSEKMKALEELSEAERRELEIRKQFTIDGALDIEGIKTEKKKDLLRVKKSGYDKRKRKYRLQNIAIYSKLIDEKK